MIVDQIILRKGIKKGDSALKSLLKAISWRIVGTVDTMMIAYVLIGDTKVAFSIGSVEVFTKMLLYYLHERAWNKFI